MEYHIIAKTLLNSWAGLADYEAMLGERAYTHAISSYSQPALHTEKIMDRIINLNIRMHTVHNLRIGLDKIINNMPTNLKQIVYAHFQKFNTSVKYDIIARRLGMSPRTYFRKLDQTIEYVARKLPAMGINFFTWQDLLHSHQWLKEAFIRECQLNRKRTPWRQKE